MRINQFKYHITTFLLFVLGTIPVFSQDSSKSTSIYILSNRVLTYENNTPIALNSVKKSAHLDYLKANKHSQDSLQIEKIDSTLFLSEISHLEGNWVVFVHGDAKTLEQSISRGLKIQNLYNVNVLIYSWPSKDPNMNGCKNFKQSQLNVDESLNHFMEALRFTQVFKETNPEFLKTKKMSLFIHSLGNLYLEKMIKNKLQIDLPQHLFDNVILNSAAVNEKNHKSWVQKLNIQQHLFIISNKNDFNLKGAHLFTSNGKQLGEKITSPLADNVTYLNFNKTIGFKFPTADSHTYFIGNMPLKNIHLKTFYNCILHGNNPDFTDGSIYRKRKDNISFEVIQTK